MKKIKLLPFVAMGMFVFALNSCSGEKTDSAPGEEGAAASAEVMTTEMLIEEANKIGAKAFEKKYAKDSEIELSGEAKFPATWEDKISVKFGPSSNDLPLTADFMFTDNGGSAEATKDKIKFGETLHFKGKLGYSFFDDKGKLKNLSVSNCKVL
ncbi:hypothetical protein [Fluviicola sp.]|uniref:hypothetical protein n=1 Tax=Fluviicola sp. TaxID=1917219 RepID=UPI002604CD9E|nr:hypothetical protein [Fluviicola sp.]